MTDHESQSPNLLDIALRAREFEIAHFWHRALFYWGFISAAFIALATTYSDHPRLALAVSCFGNVCSLCWALVNRGSKYWYEAWEAKVKKSGGESLERLFDEIEPTLEHGLWSAKRFSVSRVSIALSDYTCTLWVAILTYQVLCLLPIAEYWRNFAAGLFILWTLIFVAMLLICTRVKPKTPSPENSHRSSGSPAKGAPVR